MSTKEKFTLNKEKDKKPRLSCKNCNTSTFHKVIFSVEKELNEDEQGIWQDESYQIVICQGCHEISFRKTWQFSEDVDFDSDGQPYLPLNSELYPSRLEGIKQMSEVWYLPREIAMIYRETHAALVNKQPILAGIGIRSLIEAICNEKKAEGNTLEKKIDSLVQKGILTKEGSEILHSTRILGNKAAHEIFCFPESDLKISMDIVEHLLVGVYIIPIKAKKLPQKKTKELTEESSDISGI
jgi:hypothetical protein